MESGMGLYYFIYHLIFVLIHLLQPVVPFNLDIRSPIIFNGDRNSYFGYSVGLQIHANKSRVLVGAPKAPDITKVNSFYQCIIGRKSCDEILYLSGGTGGIKYPWLGVTIDTNPNRANYIIVCSHRNSSIYSDIFGKFLKQSGSCFEMNGTDITYLMKPPISASIGVSARFSQDGNSIIIGAPIVGNKDHGGYFLKNVGKSDPAPQIPVKANFSYAGYAVNMVDGKIVVGIPRYYEYGAIQIDTQLIVAPKNKFTFGSYFGAAIAVGDVNYDGRDDVIVGAPFYSEKYPEEGRVYILYSEGTPSLHDFSDKTNEILSVPAYRSHFGATLAVSDFNADKYKDILVGAPYENDGIGCIYIFNSYGGKLEKTPSQRIVGINIHSSIRSFGISFSRTADIDQNGYPDVAVGAYLSDQVVVLKSRPVVEMQAALEIRPQILKSILDPFWKTNENIINVTVSMHFRKVNDLVMNINLNADIGKPASRRRIYFENNKNEYSDTLKISNAFYRKTYQVKVKKIDIMEPIKFSFDYYLPDDGYRSSCILCPLLKSGNVTAQVKFDLLCGKDGICLTYFKLQLLSPSSTLLLSGERKYITIEASIENVEEHAYNAIAHIHYPPWLEYVTVRKYKNNTNNVTCSTGKKQHKLSCFLGYPMREKSSVTLLLTFLANWTPIPKDLQMNMSVTTDSNVPIKYLNETVFLTIPVKMKSVLKLFGFSETDLHVHKGSDYGTTEIRHSFILENTGPSESRNLVLHALVPYLKMRNITIMTLDSLQYDGLHDKNSNDVCTTITTDYSEENLQKINKHILNASVYDCSWMTCTNITCSFKKLKTHRSKKIQMSISIENRYLDILKGQRQNIYISTTGILNQEAKDYIIKLPASKATIKTRIYIRPLKPTLKWWIPVASILSGILLVVLVSILLYELGFFTRYQRLEEEKESLAPDERKEENANEENANEENTNEENTKEENTKEESTKEYNGD